MGRVILAIFLAIFVGSMSSAICADSVNMPERDGALAAADIEIENTPSMWKNGGYNGSGLFYKIGNNMVTVDYVPENTHLIYAENNYTFLAVVYDNEDNYLGFWNGSDIVQSASKTMFYINAEGLAPNKLKIMAKKSNGTYITVEECNNIHFLDESAAKAFAPGPTLTFIDDDGAKEALLNWESICDELGINITAALITNGMGEGMRASWEDIKRLQGKGFEFVSHTHNHIKLTESSEEKIRKEFTNSLNAFAENGIDCKYLVYPYNAIDSSLMPLVSEYFEAGVGLGGGKTDNALPIYTYHIHRYSINNTDITVEKEYNGEIISVASIKSLETLKDYIDDAVINNGWVIIMTHLRNDKNFYFDDAIRNDIIELCQYAMQKGVEIKTFGEAFDCYRNKFEEGTIYDEDYHIVYCNGVLNYR